MALQSLQNTLMIGEWIPVVNGAASLTRGVTGLGQAVIGANCAMAGALGGVTGLWKNGYEWMRFGGHQLGSGSANALRALFVLSGLELVGGPECGAAQTWFSKTTASLNTSAYRNRIDISSDLEILGNQDTNRHRIGYHLILVATLIGYDIARGAASMGHLQTLANAATKLENTLKPLDYIPGQGVVSGFGRVLLGYGQYIEGVGVTMGSAIAWAPNRLLGAVGTTEGAWSGIKLGVWTAKEGALNFARGWVAMVPWIGGKALRYYETTRFPALVR